MITIVDYGMGNIRAFVNLYERLNININVANKPDDLKNASKIILPGVGAFDHAMTQLNSSRMREELENQVFINQKPIIGICVGMQMLANSSEEGKLPGLGWINGSVKKLDISKIPYKTGLPHMGWNTISISRKNDLLNNLENHSRFYFLHSYYFECNDQNDTIAVSNYGITYTCAVNKENIYGVQFHPEKSHSNGIQLLNNFARL